MQMNHGCLFLWRCWKSMAGILRVIIKEAWNKNSQAIRSTGPGTSSRWIKGMNKSRWILNCKIYKVGQNKHNVIVERHWNTRHQVLESSIGKHETALTIIHVICKSICTHFYTDLVVVYLTWPWLPFLCNVSFDKREQCACRSDGSHQNKTQRMRACLLFIYAK